MKLETYLMGRFVQIIECDEPLINPSMNRYQVYRDMVYHRFSETIGNIYPILSQRLGERLATLISAFQSVGAQSVLMSDMAYEFGLFVKAHPMMQDEPYLADLLWLEWGEMELLLEQFNEIKSEFEWSGHYRLASWSRLRQLHFPIHRGNFESNGKYPLLLYYDFDENRVYFEEITPLGYDALMLLQEYPCEQILSEISQIYQVDTQLLKEPLGQLLTQWCEKKILTKEV